MERSCRREFLHRTVVGAAYAAMAGSGLSAAARRYKLALSPGAIGVQAAPPQVVDLAARHGFEAVEANGGYLASLSSDDLTAFARNVKARGLEWGVAGLPVEFRQSRAKFEEGLGTLRKIAPALERAGATRVSTWIMPFHEELTYLQNLRQHTARLTEVAGLLSDHGLRFGLEYVGTPSLRAGKRYPFAHTAAETAELIAEIGKPNVGFVLDSWHWWCAGETAADIRKLSREQIVSVDLNDAPAGIPKEQQVDGRRELPGATGVIDVAGFLDALTVLEYEGPVRAEPFNKAVSDMDDEAACAATIAALKKTAGSRQQTVPV